MRSADILIFMRMSSDIATCMYYTGLDPFTRQPETPSAGTLG